MPQRIMCQHILSGRIMLAVELVSEEMRTHDTIAAAFNGVTETLGNRAGRPVVL